MFSAFQKISQALQGISAVVTDAYFNLVTLLLNTTATNGAQNNTFLDSSTNNFSITRNGNTTQGTFTPFSQTGWSTSFLRANTDYLGLPNGSTPLGSNDFSIEAYVYLLNRDSSYAWFAGNTDRASAGGSSFTLNIAGSSGYFACDFWIGGGNNPINGTMAVPINTWVHLAVCRTSGTLSQFIDGVRTATTTISGSVNAGSATYNPSIGSNGTGSADNFTGYISNLRLIIGSGGYNATSSTIIVPTAPLTATANTKVLSCQSNRFVDNSANNYTITPSGSPSVQAFSPFVPDTAYSTTVVGGSGYFDGTGDYLTTPSSTNLALGTGAFTVEAWFYSPANTDGVLSSIDSGSGSYGLGIYFASTTSLKIAIQSNSVEVVGYSATITKNTWYHVAASRDASNNYSVYINGARIGTTTNSTNISLQTWGIGRTYANSGSSYSGYISGVRIVKGSAVYDPTQSTLTIPTAPPTAVTNTSLLLNYTNAGIFDSAAKNDLETVGNAQVSTTQAKWGTTSMYFDGTGDYLTAPTSPVYDFSSGNFTIEVWYYPTISNPNAGIFSKRANGSVYAPFSLEFSSSLAPVFLASTSGSNWDINITSSVSCTQNAWNYIAVTRSGSTFTIYVNGSSGGTGSSSSALMTNTSSISVGAVAADGTRVLTGYLDDFRVTKGFARTVTSSPTAAFPIQ